MPERNQQQGSPQEEQGGSQQGQQGGSQQGQQGGSQQGQQGGSQQGQQGQPGRQGQPGKQGRPGRQGQPEAEAEGNAASASSDAATAAVASDADADADAGDARSRLTASPRAAAGDDRSVASNVNIVLMPDTGMMLAALAVALSGGRSGLGGPEADLIRSLVTQQERSNRELIEALKVIAGAKR